MSILSRTTRASSTSSNESEVIAYESLKAERKNPNKVSTFPQKPFLQRTFAEKLCSLAVADPSVHRTSFCPE